MEQLLSHRTCRHPALLHLLRMRISHQVRLFMSSRRPCCSGRGSGIARPSHISWPILQRRAWVLLRLSILAPMAIMQQRTNPSIATFFQAVPELSTLKKPENAFRKLRWWSFCPVLSVCDTSSQIQFAAGANPSDLRSDFGKKPAGLSNWASAFQSLLPLGSRDFCMFDCHVPCVSSWSVILEPCLRSACRAKTQHLPG